MKFECKKTENCFSNSQTYEYALETPASELLEPLGELGEVRTNYKFRRPVFSCDLADGANVKGIIAEKVIKASYPDERVSEAKAAFEAWLGELFDSEDQSELGRDCRALKTQ